MDIDAIKEQFDRVISYSQGIENPKTEMLFRTWLRKKEWFIEKFGNKLIYEYPQTVSFEISEEEKKSRFESFSAYAWDVLERSEFGGYLDWQREGFFKNRVVSDYWIYDEAGNKSKLIQKGTKLIKTFKYFIKDEELLHSFESKASQIIQENKIEGTLCFSVHPLDYLSISENDYNWRSCHALDGEYRAGNISYMVDDCTVVCYLKGKHDAVLPRFPEDVKWNSKKWRVLLYISNNKEMIFAGKQYPFSSESGMKLIIDKCFSKTGYNWSNWIDHKISNEIVQDDIRYRLRDTYVPLSGSIVPLGQLMEDAPGSRHFNDVLKSSCYDPIYSIKVKPYIWGETADEKICMSGSSTHFTVGGNTLCLHCGQETVLDGSGTMRCYDCEFEYGTEESDVFGYCDKCGMRMELEDAHYIENDEAAYCQECYERYCARCENCGEVELIENMHYVRTEGVYVCDYCYQQEEEE